MHMINVWIDGFVPCLIDVSSGDIVETEVIRIRRKSFLKKFNTKTGWYTNWEKLVDENDIYALVVKGTVDIQGMVALRAMDNFHAVYIAWMCTAPHNNPVIASQKKYQGVGGHLFAVAAQKSLESGYEGALTGNAANMDLVNHYIEAFNAEFMGILHPYQFFINEINASRIVKEYTYEWTDDEL